jgi:hypothetical protein
VTGDVRLAASDRRRRCEWPAYTGENGQYPDIGATLEVGSGIENAYVAPPEREG